METEQQNDLPEVLDITAFDAVKEILEAKGYEGGEVSLSAAKVERLTTPCAQLLIAFLKEGAGNRHIVAASAAMQTAWQDFGLESFYSLTTNPVTVAQ
jgi:hypothetical protein